MRKLAIIALLLAACTTTTTTPPSGTPGASPGVTPAAAATAAPPPPEPHGFTLEEEAHILLLEDRRGYDADLAIQWLSNPNALHRQRMALALAHIGPHVFVDPNNNVERDADEHQAGVDLLARLVTDPDRNVRETAAFALGEIGDMWGADALVQFASDANDAGVAAEAVEALSKLAPKLPLARYTPFTAATQRDGIRARAIRFLFRFNSDEASAIAAQALESPSPLIRQESAYALARRAYAPARAKLELLVTDPSVLTRAYAATALGRIGARESVPVLLGLFSDQHPWVRTNACVALGRLAAKDAAALDRPELAQDVLRVMALTDDPDPGTRASSIDPLGWYATKSEAAKKRLMEIASSSGSRWDRELAVGAIARHFGDATPSPLDALWPNLTGWEKVRIAEATTSLKTNGAALRARLAKDPDPMVRFNAISAVPDANVAAESAIVDPAILDPDPVVRAYAVSKYALDTSIPAAKRADDILLVEQKARNDKQNDARIAAIQALGDLDFPERDVYFHGLMHEMDPVARRAAADVIEEKLKEKRPQYTPFIIIKSVDDYIEIVKWARQQHTATIHMTRGKIELQLLTQDAPLTTWNFAQLAKAKYFDNTSFMRVVPNFVIQGGDPRNDQEGSPGYAIRDEINLQKYTRGAVGMALSGPDTGGSQFFITHSPQPHLDGGYTIFGRVYEGMNGVVDQTERGDKVETITIDEHPPVSRKELASTESSMPATKGTQR